MFRFVETSDKDAKKFAQLLYKQFFIDGDWKFGGNDVAGIKGWPERLDIENFELHSVGSDHVSFMAGGDWQQMVICSIVKDWNKDILKITPFDFYPEMSVEDKKTALERLRIAGSE
jgi:hypothetical protein